MIQIRFTRQGSNSMMGSFSSGDLARVSEAFADHLVNEARVAEYVESPAKAEPAPAAAKPRRFRKNAA